MHPSMAVTGLELAARSQRCIPVVSGLHGVALHEGDCGEVTLRHIDAPFGLP